MFRSFPGRGFLRRMIDLTKGVKKPHHYIHRSSGAKRVLCFGSVFWKLLTGARFSLVTFGKHSQALQLYTNSAGSIGFGAVFGRYWFYGSWPGHWKI